MDLSAEEIRVLACLLEKQRTTPDVYPLSLNALRTACNQSTSRDPVVQYDETTIRDAMALLSRRRFARLASGARAAKYRHLMDEALDLSVADQALLSVMMLRGPQTLNELRTRTERMHHFADAEQIADTLRTLIARGLVVDLGRRPGQKEGRFGHLLSADAEDAPPPIPEAAHAPADTTAPAPSGPVAAAPPVAATPAPAAPPPAPPSSEFEERIADLEYEVAELKRSLADLREQLGA